MRYHFVMITLVFCLVTCFITYLKRIWYVKLFFTVGLDFPNNHRNFCKNPTFILNIICVVALWCYGSMLDTWESLVKTPMGSSTRISEEQILIEQSTLTPINKMAMTSSAKLQLTHCLMCIRLDFWGSQIAHGILGTLKHDINCGTNPNNLSFKKISCVPHGIRISFGKKSWVQILPYIYFPNWVSSHASLERGFHDLFTKILLHIYLPNLVTPHASLKDVSLIYLLMGMGHM